MQFRTAAVFASFVVTVLAHTRVWGVWVNGVDQGDGRDQYVRSPPSNNPLKDLSQSNIACNVKNRNVPQTINVKAGDQLSFECRNDDILDYSHKGPVLVYIAPASSNAQGQAWTKLWHSGYSNGQWAVDSFIATRGRHFVNIPDVPAGDYLLRAEIIALHEANVSYEQNSSRGAQFYPSCVQIRVTSNGNQNLPGDIGFPGGYTYSTPGIVWNIYEIGRDQNSYPIPGPSVWSGSAGGGFA